MITVKTNNKPRELVTVYDLPTPELKRLFDYIQGEDVYSARLFAYRGEWYDTNEFVVANQEIFPKWHGQQSESFFSGLVIRYTPDMEQVVVGRYYA